MTLVATTSMHAQRTIIQVALKYGSAPYIGLGFSVWFLLLTFEVFGSPFMRNTMVIW